MNNFYCETQQKQLGFCYNCHLSSRGIRQSQRNNSNSIWAALTSNAGETMSLLACPFCMKENKPYREPIGNYRQHFNQFLSSTSQQKNQLIRNPQESQKHIAQQIPAQCQAKEQQKQFVRSSNIGKHQLLANNQDKQATKYTKIPTTTPKNNFMRTENTFLGQNSDAESATQRKMIAQYLQTQKPFTRTLTNSAFSKLYNAPVRETYGKSNLNPTGGGFIYGNFMKTHNIMPHSRDNTPKKYQSYKNALNFGKRTKRDFEAEWMKIQRQLAKVLNLKLVYKQKQEINKTKKSFKSKSFEKYAVDKVKMKRSHSAEKVRLENQLITQANENNTLKDYKKPFTNLQKQPYYVYKYRDNNGETRLACDRHAITCYIDNGFKDNQAAYQKFLMKTSPIQLEDISDPDDINIQQIKAQNYIESQVKGVSKHYLLPNCEEPYNPLNYTFQKKKSLQNTTASIQ